MSATASEAGPHLPVLKRPLQRDHWRVFAKSFTAFIVISSIEICIQQPASLQWILQTSSWLPRGSLCWAVADELAHGCAACSIWLTYLQIRTETIFTKSQMLMQGCLAFAMGMVIDVDHYVWGALFFGDVSMSRARNLGSIRPLPHCVPVMMLCALASAYVGYRVWAKAGLQHRHPALATLGDWQALCLVAWSLHLLRDGIHRGVWYFPSSTVYSTSCLPAPLYVLCAAGVPALLGNKCPWRRLVGGDQQSMLQAPAGRAQP
jgi:hypothetical protein